MDEAKEDAKEWLRRAKSNLAKARGGRVSEEIYFEDLCFDCHQAIEKSLKSLCIMKKIMFPWTHNISTLVSLLENNGIKATDDVKKAEKLTDFALSFRYPGEEPLATEEQYRDALYLATSVVNWVETFFQKGNE